MKPFLKKVYMDFYRRFKANCHANRLIVELGSGEHGFIKQVMPNVVTSDVRYYRNDAIVNAEEMVFRPASIDGLLMLNVLHHIRPYKFLGEAQRVLVPGGRVIMIEPANTLWSRFVYQRFHRTEYFDPTGTSQIGNNAGPWIIFNRERRTFDKGFPQLRIVSQELHTPFAYALSGGNGRKYGAPGFLYPVVRAIEWLLVPLNRWLAMYQTIVLEKSAA
jgi:SAM-dependent methyltransferase